MSVLVKAIAAMSKNRVIGSNGKLPWHIKEDITRFLNLTTGHTVLMGRKTFDSLPPSVRPLPNRLNVVISRQDISIPNVITIKNPIDFIRDCKNGKEKIAGNILWIIGGAQIYKTTVDLWDEMYLTYIDEEFKGDAFLQPFEDEFVAKSVEQSSDPRCKFIIYTRKQCENLCVA